MPIFLAITVVVLLATYLGVLPKGMTGCFVFMIIVGDILLIASLMLSVLAPFLVV